MSEMVKAGFLLRKINLSLIGFYFALLPFNGIAQPARIGALNLSEFSAKTKAASSSSDTSDKGHPDFGFLPIRSAPCSDCFEELGQRTANHRRFVKEGANGNRYYEQFAAGAINYRDENGSWREIDTRLHPKGKGEFVADRQPVPVILDLNHRLTRLVINGIEYTFNKNISLWHKSSLGQLTSLGIADWSNYTAGDQGAIVREIYPGVDLVLQVREGAIESGFLVRRKLPYSDGEIVLKMEVEFPQGTRIAATIPQEVESGAHTSFVFSSERQAVCQLKSCFAFDDSPENGFLALNTSFKNDNFSISVPVWWLNDQSRRYPVLIDPVVTTQGILTNGTGGVDGTRYSPVCWTNGCDYSLTVPTPANARLTGVFSSFEYYAAAGACQGRDGGYSISLNGCTSPSTAPGVFTCASSSTNYYCGATNTDITTDLSGCLPPDRCSSQNLTFTLHFYRCNNDPDTTCSASCISASQPWIITVEGRDLELPFTSTVQQICAGQTTEVVAVAQNGIGPYTYSWSPVSGNSDTLSVSPSVTSTYTVVVTDQCGTTRTGSSTVNVQPLTNPGFNVNPLVGCTNSPVTLSGLGGFSAGAYDWIVPGSNASSGIITNTPSPVIQYSLPGVYPITLGFQSGGCTIDSTLQFVVQTPSPAQVSLSANPSGVLCPGATVLFTATSVNGGASPVYGFYRNGSMLQSGNATTIQMTNLQNGDIVQVVMASSASTCVSPLVDTASLFIAVSGLAVPEVLLSATPSLCQGVPVTLNAVPVNGGSSPIYQWEVNGLPVPGTTGPSFSFTPGVNDTSVAVIMTSSQSCVSSLTASNALSIGPATAAAVTLQSSSGGGICNGQPVTVTAMAVNGGASPSYVWLLNGMPTGDTGAVFTSGSLVSGDIVSVQLTSSSACAVPSVAQSTPLQIQVFPPLSALVFGASPVCAGSPVTLAVAASGGDGGPYAYVWNGTATTAPSFSFTPAVNQYVTLEVNDACGSAPVRDSAYIIVKPLPQAAFTYLPSDPTTSTPGVSFTDQSRDVISVFWTFGDGDTSTQRNPSHAYPLPGTYTVTQLGMAANGCVDTVAYELVVVEDAVVYFPNAFTPNNDLYNDRWLPVTLGSSSFDYFIFDRWGHVVFEGDETTAWDGTFKSSGKQVPPGIYTFLFKFNPEKKEKAELNGRITLIR